MSLRQDMLNLIEENTPVQVILGTVVSVDSGEMTCEVKVTGAPNLLDVRLKSVIDGNVQGINIYPKVKSFILVGVIDNRKESAFVCGFSEVEKLSAVVDKTSIEISKDGIKAERNGLNFKTVIEQGFNSIKTAVITTPAGPGALDLTSQTNIELALKKLNEILI